MDVVGVDAPSRGGRSSSSTALDSDVLFAAANAATEGGRETDWDVVEVFFFLLNQPRTGGDTLFTSQVSTLKRFSPAFIAFLKTLKAVHSGVEQADFSRSGRRGGIVRREPVEHIHPLVRKHPVTGEEALYVNRQFTRRIVGLKKEESGG